MAEKLKEKEIKLVATMEVYKILYEGKKYTASVTSHEDDEDHVDFDIHDEKGKEVKDKKIEDGIWKVWKDAIDKEIEELEELEAKEKKKKGK